MLKQPQKNDAQFKSGQKRLKTNHFDLLVPDTLCI